MNLGEQFQTDVATAFPETPLRAVARLMQEKNVGAVVVVRSPERTKEVVGIVTDRDLALRVLGDGVAGESPVSEIMTRKVITIWNDEGLFNATQYFLGHKIRRLPVVNHQNELVGMVTFDDVLALLARELFNISKAVSPALNNEPGIPSRPALM